MRIATRDNLRTSFSGESQASSRYKIWGDHAKKEGFPTVDRLFKATADAEIIHATLHFNALKDEKGDALVAAMGGFGIGSTSENLQAAIDGETYEFTEMYPSFIAVAEMQNEEDALHAMRFAMAAEKVHAERYQTAKDAVDAGKDLEAEEIHLCVVCGYIGFDSETEVCPICGAKRSAFVQY